MHRAPTGYSAGYKSLDITMVSGWALHTPLSSCPRIFRRKKKPILFPPGTSNQRGPARNVKFLGPRERQNSFFRIALPFSVNRILFPGKSARLSGSPLPGPTFPQLLFSTECPTHTDFCLCKTKHRFFADTNSVQTLGLHDPLFVGAERLCRAGLIAGVSTPDRHWYPAIPDNLSIRVQYVRVGGRSSTWYPA